MTALNCRYISFDIFDTLIHRSVAVPSDVFRLMEAFGGSVPTGFANQRMEAEQSATRKANRPVTLDEIYEALQPVYGNQIHELMNLELQMELAGCRPNSDMVALLQRYVQAGKDVVLISDMYLPSKHIVPMLEKCGVYGYKSLFVSCEAGATKAEGTLFDVVLASLNIRPHELLHIGDNFKSDALMPLLKGIRVQPVKRKKNDKSAARSKDCYDALIQRTLAACRSDIVSGMDLYERLGCETFGPLLAGFSKWLLDSLHRNGIRDVYFLSRDGYIMKRAFDMLAHQEIRTHYLYCSRRSYTVPLLWEHSSLESIFENITIQSRMTMRSFILSIGLNPEDYETRAAKYGIGLDDLFEEDSFKSSEAVARFYEEIKPEVEAVSKKEYEALNRYILSQNLGKQIAVVDIGYHGTMQNALEQAIYLAGIDVQVKGYYVGIKASPLISNNMIQAEGYLYAPGRNEDLDQQCNKFVPIYESIFLAQHGSVRRFVVQGDGVEPELFPYEYDGETIEALDESKIIRAYQSGALKLVERIYKAFPFGLPSLPPSIALQSMIRMGTKPTLREARLWGDFRVFDHILTFIAKPRRISSYLRHPKQFKEDFMKCTWKIGFMRRCLLLPLPYNRIYEMLKAYFHREKEA